MHNMEIYEASRRVPDEAKKAINAGRLKGMTDINPMWRIKKLTELFGPVGIGWYYKTIRRWTETNEATKEVCAFVDIELYIKSGEAWSAPIEGTGGSKMVSMEKNGPYVDDECYKKAQTDAISVACKALGIGADVYWQSDRSKYSPEGMGTTQPTAAQQQTTANPEELINGHQRADILRELNNKNLPPAVICREYKISDLSFLPASKYDEVIRRLGATTKR